MQLFDCNCLIGSRSADVPGVDGSADGLLEEMDRLGIGRALVCHVLAKESHPRRGNEALLKEVEGRPRLQPCWALLPPASGEMPPPAQLVEEMKAAGVKAARLFPAAHNFPFTLLNLGELLEALAAHAILLLVDYDIGHWSQDPVDWTEVVRIGERFPDLSMIFVGCSLLAPRVAYSAMTRVRGLCLETSYFQLQRGLEHVVSRFDASRLLFGTGLPYRSPGPPLAMLQMSGLSAPQKDAVAGGNLRRLLGMPDEAADGREETAHGLRIIDSHAHLGQWASSVIPDGDAPALVRDMDACGVEAAIVSSFQGISCAWKRGNREVAAAIRAFPRRLYGYAVANPNHPDEIAAELEWCFGQEGFVGVKLHCALHAVPLGHPAYDPAFEFADAHGLPVLVHDEHRAEVIEPLLERFGRARILAAHAGRWDGRLVPDAIRLAAAHENLFLDLAASAVYHGALERMVEIAGVEKVLYGSDCPLMDQSYQMGRVLHARLTRDQKEAILHENSRRLFGLDAG